MDTRNAANLIFMLRDAVLRIRAALPEGSATADLEEEAADLINWQAVQISELREALEKVDAVLDGYKTEEPINREIAHTIQAPMREIDAACAAIGEALSRPDAGWPESVRRLVRHVGEIYRSQGHLDGLAEAYRALPQSLRDEASTKEGGE